MQTKYKIDASAEKEKQRSCFSVQTSVIGIASNAFFSSCTEMDRLFRIAQHLGVVRSLRRKHLKFMLLLPLELGVGVEVGN